MGQHEDGSIVPDLFQGRREIVRTPPVTAPRRGIGQLVGEPRDPEALASTIDPHGFVLEHPDADAVQGPRHLVRAARHAGNGTVPPIVVAEHRIGPERSLQHRKRIGPGGRHHGTRHDPVPRVEVAEQDDQVRRQGVGLLGDAPDAFRRHPGFTGMDVGDDADPQRQALGPARRRGDVVANQGGHFGLYRDRVSAERQGPGQDAGSCQKRSSRHRYHGVSATSAARAG